MAERVSLFIIAKNEETKIARCIASTKGLVSEIIVVDAYSKDKTAEIAAQHGALVFQHAFEGFAAQKNFALSKVSSPWALNLDADECLSAELKEEIRQIIQDTSHTGFNIPFFNYFLGRKMNHSGLNHEYHLRLVRTDKAHYEGGLVHEGLKVEGTVGTLTQPIRHYSYDNIETYFRKLNKYTTLAATQLHEKGRKFSLLFVLVTIPLEFVKRYILKAGFLDGIRGFIWASFSAFYVYVKYMKLWLLEQKKGSKK